MSFQLLGEDHRVDDPLQSVEEETDEEHEFHRHGFLGNTRVVPRFFRGEHGGVPFLGFLKKDGHCVESFPCQPLYEFCGN